jgi:hypothetical protein
MRLLTFLAYCAFVFGAIGIFASRYYGLPKGLHLSIFVIGFGFLIGAFESLHTRRMSLRASNEAAAAYDGTPALIWGLMLLIVAGGIIGTAYLLDAGQWNTTMNHLHQRPGPLYMLGGLLLAGCGALAFVNPQGRRVWWKMLLFRAPRVLLATLLVIAGLVSVACGVWEWLEPRGFERTTHTLLSKLDFRSFDGFAHSVLRLVGGNK